jgi:hypothetical protein
MSESQNSDTKDRSALDPEVEAFLQIAARIVLRVKAKQLGGPGPRRRRKTVEAESQADRMRERWSPHPSEVWPPDQQAPP